MKIGLLTIGLGRAARPATTRVIAEQCDRLGFGTLWAPEHVVLFDRYGESKYPYSEDGAFAAPGTIDWMDPFVALSFVAARTSRVRLATGICLVPEHNPLELARKSRRWTISAADASRSASGSDGRLKNSLRWGFHSNGARSARANTSK
jgi:hypothetical protein